MIKLLSRKFVKRKTTDAFYSKLIVMFYYAVMFNNIIKRIVGYEGNLILLGLISIIALYILFNTRRLTRTFVNTLAISLLAYLFIFAVGFVISGKSSSTLVKYISQGSVFILFGVAMYSIRDYRVLMHYLRINSYGFLAVLSLILFGFSSGYIMSHSYLMLIPTLLHITMAFLYHSKLSILCLVLEAFIILTVGSRGPLLVIALYFVLLVLFCIKKRIFKIILIAAILLFVYFFFFNSELTYNVLNNLGIHSRSVELLFSNFSYDSGRGEIYEVGQKLIDERPILGWGLAGETPFMESGGYVHNIVLEFQIDYGRVLGITFFVLLNVLYLVAIFKSRCSWLVIMFICIGYIPLFMSNSYLLSFDFYLSFFLCLKIAFRKVKRRRKVIHKVEQKCINVAC